MQPSYCSLHVSPMIRSPKEGNFALWKTHQETGGDGIQDGDEGQLAGWS